MTAIRGFPAGRLAQKMVDKLLEGRAPDGGKIKVLDALTRGGAPAGRTT